MARWENHSGSTVSVPAVGRDVDAEEVVEVPDDVILPSNYFRPEGAPVEVPVPAPVIDAPQGEGE